MLVTLLRRRHQGRQDHGTSSSTTLRATPTATVHAERRPELRLRHGWFSAGNSLLGVTLAHTDTVQLDEVFTGSLGRIGINRQSSETDASTGLGDVAPLVQSRWSSGTSSD